MTYDPFARGPHTVGVMSVHLQDATRARSVPLEIWHPSSGEAGADLDAQRQDRFRSIPNGPESVQSALRDAPLASGRFPLVLFSHGFAGHRRQTTHFCCHLASHGYVMAGVDHLGNTVADVMSLASSARNESQDRLEALQSLMRDRPADIRFAIDRLLAGDAGIPASALRDDAVGIAGHSFGGWTALRVAGEDPRIRAVMPMAPAGAASPLGSAAKVLADGLDPAWHRDVPTLYLAAEYDTLLPLAGIRELHARNSGSKRLVVLHDADHMHFCDRVEDTHDVFRMMGSVLLGGLVFDAKDLAGVDALLDSAKPSSELCPGRDAYTLIQGLGVAHMDAHLKQDARAADWLAGDLVASLASRGVSIESVAG